MPKAQCLLREGRGSCVVAGGGRLGGLVHERLEDPRVENARPRPIRYPAPRRSRATSCGASTWRSLETYASRLCAADAGGLSPRDLVDQALVRYDVARTEQHGTQNGAPLAAAEIA